MGSGEERVRVCDIRTCCGNSTGCPGLQRRAVLARFHMLQVRDTWETPPVSTPPGAEGLPSAAKHRRKPSAVCQRGWDPLVSAGAGLG